MTTMTDREMLELAAKAAGIWVGNDDFTDPIDRKYVDSMGLWVHVGNLEDMGKWWNPKNNDGDALRLAAKLHIGVEFWPDVVRAWSGDSDQIFDEQALDHNGNHASAVRSAIVRAATDMGKLK